MEVREPDLTSDSDESYSSVEADNLPSLVTLDNLPGKVRLSPDPERRKTSLRGVGWLFNVATSLVGGGVEEHPEEGGTDSVGNSSHSLTIRPGESVDDLRSSSSTNLLEYGEELDHDNEFHDAVNAPDQFSDSAASHDSQYMFDNQQHTEVVKAERRSSSSIDPDHGDADKLGSTNSVFLPDTEKDHTRKHHSKRRVGKSHTETLLFKEGVRTEDDTYRHSYRNKRHDRSLRRDPTNKLNEDAEKIRRKVRRHDSDKKSSTKESEGKTKKHREKTSIRDRSMTVRKKRVDSERGSDNSLCKEDSGRKGHHPSLKTPDRPSSVDRKPAKDNTLTKHQRQYLTSEELAKSSSSLLSVVKQEGVYDGKEKLAPRRPSERKTRKKIEKGSSSDHPYNNYDSTSEKHLRKERKRLKHPKLTKFSDMGRIKHGSNHGSKSRTRPSSNALVLRSESRRDSIGVSTLSKLGIIGVCLKP